MAARKESGPVLVVGAGPVGMTAALTLRAAGLPVTVLEAGARDRVRPGSRALFVHRRSLRLLERARPGLGARIAAYGTTWHTRRTLYRGREVFARTFPRAAGDGGYEDEISGDGASGDGAAALPAFTSLRQVDTERFLFEACTEAGVEFRFDAEVHGVRSDGDEVTVTAKDGGSWTAGHVIAADGARSGVRGALDIPLEGTRSEGYHVVVDVAEPAGGDLPVERVFHYEHPGTGGRTVLRVPFTGGFQIDLQCRADDPPESFGTEKAVRRWLPRLVGEDCAHRVLWVSRYHFVRKVAASFADPSGRVLLAGEAAHLFPPFGARGMNSGIADAVAAAEAVSAACSEPSRGPAAVAGYAAARRSAALHNSEAAGAALDHLRPRPWKRAAQRAAATLAPVVPRCGEWLERAPYGPRGGPARGY
ncbi:FAD-dependent oxidoreductase [Streptomyces sp. 11-1-2]|uniref:FAD-dependent oxidoreductase n=1 Tax=unclassified Streptomyces TaxID=2593676 RepID=UPI000B8D4B11|nr:FAD-dependent oxidoreductase [Streptomyces sp. 11-1-2]ASQ92888.1 monooxygenase [Streptomyces sp. 11-1-2]